MNTEDIMKLLSHSKIEVQGDFVVKKEVQFEVNNVEPGGVAFLIGDKEMAERLLANHTVGQPVAKPHHKESAAETTRQTVANCQMASSCQPVTNCQPSATPNGTEPAAAEQAVASRKTASNCQPVTNCQPSATPNGTEPAAAEQAAASRKTAASSQPIAEQPTVDQTSANSQWTGNDPMSHPTESTHSTGQGASHPTPQYRALFIRNDGSSAENREVREQEQKRFMKYLKNYRLTNHVLTCASDNPLNDVVTGFVLKWINRKLIHSNPTGTAIFRFLTVDCGLQSEVSDRSYGNKIMTRIKLRHCSNKTRDNINLYFD
ncbi:MAG: hypothetical protein SOY43_03600 [Parabacteroides sp.]|nr:hypothetical protein [bacterium]MDY4101963.1 hypothetical protein [Parabacteroides sp.]